MKASNIHGIPLATDNKIVVRHRLYTPTLNSATFQHSIANDTATLQHVLQCYRNLSARSGNIREPFPHHIQSLRIGVGTYTTTFRMPLRKNMPNGPDGKVLPIYWLYRKVPETSKILSATLLQGIGAVVHGRHKTHYPLCHAACG